MNQKNLRIAVVSLWIWVAVISLNHIFQFWDGLIFSTSFIGKMGWLTLFFSLVYLCLGFLKQVLFLFFTFLCLGYWIGPFLEPPSDPIIHLKKTYGNCEKKSNEVERLNKGFWHYSMSGRFICSSSTEQNNPETVLRKIDLLHGVYWGILVVSLFILGKSTGLPDQWAFLSCLLVFLFFGTNRFSYFSYYSFAPSLTSLMIYWLWTAAFFFRKNRREIVHGILMAVLAISVLLVNHVQEAVFLGLIVSIWLVLNLHEHFWEFLHKLSDLTGNTNRKTGIKTLYISSIFFLLFILPQFESFRTYISTFFINNQWENNQSLVFFWNGFHLFGKIWGHRVHDTLGIMGFLPLVFLGLFFLPRSIFAEQSTANRLVILGILPFICYFVPLIQFVWLSNSIAEIYYRISYTSMFWLPIAYFLWFLGEHSPEFFSKIKSMSALKGIFVKKKILWRRCYFAGCLIAIVFIGGIRSGPVYGKLDFVLLDGRPWWREWKPMIKDLLKQEEKMIYSDMITSYIMDGVFNQPAVRSRFLSRNDYEDIHSMDQKNSSHTYRCMINLHGFTPTWVPVETGHWQWDLSNTALSYHYQGITGPGLEKALRINPPKNCNVFY
jgi:hypothetical protein